jgi:hypothetical protein
MAGALWFGLPVGLLAYAAFHLLLKQPLADLLPASLSGRLHSFASASLPGVSRLAVVASVLAGVLTHVGWDALVHDYSFHGHNVLQHLSTLIGTLVLAWWCLRTVRRLPEPERTPGSPMPRAARIFVVAALLAAGLGVALWSAPLESLQMSTDLGEVRRAVRTSGLAALWTLGVALLAYCTLWHLARGKLRERGGP